MVEIPIQLDPNHEVRFFAEKVDEGLAIAILDIWEGKRKVCLVQLDEMQLEKLREVL